MMSIQELNVNPRILQAVRKARLLRIKDLYNFTKPQLERKLRLSSQEIDALLQAASSSVYPATGLRLVDVFRRECDKKFQHFTLGLGCATLDGALQGGILLPGLTEVSGESSAGKTQLCMQLCLSCQLPTAKGGLNSGALYISTEDAFPVKRLKQMADTFHDTHKQHLSKSFMDNIFIEHAGDLDDLWQILQRKANVLLERGLVKLIVVDSIAALFRAEFDMDEMNERSYALVMFGKELVRLSRSYTIAIICVNQVSDVMNNDSAVNIKGKRRLKPALGLTWSYMVTTRISLSRTSWNLSSLLDSASQEKLPHDASAVARSDPVVRILKVMFSPHLSNREVYYYVDEAGVHGIDL